MKRILRSPVMWVILGAMIFSLYDWILSRSVVSLVATCMILVAVVLQARAILRGERADPLLIEKMWQRWKRVLIGMTAGVFIAMAGLLIAAAITGVTSVPSWASLLLAWALIFLAVTWGMVAVGRWRAKRYGPSR